MQDELIRRACELLEDGTVNRVLGWQKGQFVYDITPAVFTSVEEVKNNFVYNDFCGANLSKYLRSESEKEGKVLVFLKPCDTYSFNQLLTEYKIHRDNVYAVGIECYGKADVEKFRAKGIDCITDVKNENGTLKISTIYGEESVPAMDVMAERCLNCKSKKHVAYDELIGEDGEVLDSHRFDEVEEIEKMSAEERFKFWQSQLSKCIRCNACRNVCPACTCEKCVFDNYDSGAFNKAPANSFEESMFHIIRAFHVAGRCTDCGECSRVCPEHIPLHLLNRKFIKDYNELYGPFMAGAEVGQVSPVVDYTKDKDAEASVVQKGGAE